MFAIPKGWPLRNVFSVGDVIIVVAIAYFAHTWCRRNVAEAEAEADAPADASFAVSD